MLADGNRPDKLARAVVVDSCSSCATYHLDLSKTAFGELREHTKGTGKIIWGIYSKKGERLAGPFYNSVDGGAKQNNMSKDSFISAFDANAKSLAASSHNSAKFSTSGKISDYYDDDIKEKKTTSYKARTTTKKLPNNNAKKTTKVLPTVRKTKTLPGFSGSSNRSGYSGPSVNSGRFGNSNSKNIPSGYSNSAKSIPSANQGYSNNSKSLPVNGVNNDAKVPPYRFNVPNNSKTLPVNAGLNSDAKSIPSNGFNVATNPKTLPAKAGLTNDAKTLPVFGNNNEIPAKTLPNVEQTTVAPNVVPTVSSAQNENKKEEDNKDNENKLGTTIGILAVSGGAIGAAGAGLFLLKKKNPSTYEGLKQKFPDAFATVKRSLSRKSNYDRSLPRVNNYERNEENTRFINKDSYHNENKYHEGRYQYDGRYHFDNRYINDDGYCEEDGRYYV